MLDQRRVVVTGMGLLCGIGNTAQQIWEALLAGRSGMAEITAYDLTGHSVRFAAEVKDFDPHVFVEKKEARKMGRFIHFAMAASAEAMAHSGLVVTAETSDMVGVHIGSGIGGFDVIEREHTALMNGGPRKISPFFIPASIVNLAAGHVSIKYGAKGPNEATATACTSSAHSIGDAFRIIQRGDADAMIAGGAEGAITPLSVGGFAAMKALSTRNDDPTHACRPWDKDRDGFVVGEGAGILILEELEFAKARGANILAEVIGYGMSGDAFHMTGMAPEGEGCYRAMAKALKVAGISADKIDYVNAHATSTPLGDALDEIDDGAPAWWGWRVGSRHYDYGDAEPDGAADDEPGERRSRVPVELCAEQAAALQDRLCAFEQLWVWRDEWVAGVQALGRGVARSRNL